MSNQSKRIYRVSLVTALALAIAYALRIDLPFIAPLFTFLLALRSEQPINLKSLLVLMVVIAITLSCGLLLITMLQHYPFTGLMLAALGIYKSAQLIGSKDKVLVGIFFMMGITMLSSVGTLSFVFALTMMNAIMMGVFIAVVCQWLVFPWFAISPSQEKPTPAEAESENSPNKQASSYNIALQTTAIVFPVYLLALTNPALYLPLILKSVLLGQQTSNTDIQKFGDELLLSTLAGGVLAIALWGVLQIQPNLWIFFLLTLLSSLYVCRKMFTEGASQFTPSFWQNALVTMFILVGPAVQDTLVGNDPFRAFAVRMSLYIALSIYAWFAAYFIERFRLQRQQSNSIATDGAAS